jgi:hypothetical protein
MFPEYYTFLFWARPKENYMFMYKIIIQTYCAALKTNDYDTMIGLFSKDAKVFSFFAGEKPAQEFFLNLFKTSRRTTVELKKFFIELENKTTIAAYLYIRTLP